MSQRKKNSFKRGFKSWSDKKAIEIRRELGLKAIQPLSAFDLCKHLSIPLFIPQEIIGLELKYVEILLGEGKGHWSAATIPLSDEKSLIIHNPSHSDQRQQSNLMHEIAHIICGHKVDSRILETGLGGFLRHHNREQEDEANWLGACLQLPREALIWALKQRMTISEISSYFYASEEMVNYRINISGVKNQLSRSIYFF